VVGSETHRSRSFKVADYGQNGSSEPRNFDLDFYFKVINVTEVDASSASLSAAVAAVAAAPLPAVGPISVAEINQIVR